MKWLILYTLLLAATVAISASDTEKDGSQLIGEDCRIDDDCINNSKCSSTKHCGCDPGWTPKFDKTLCLSIINDTGTSICEESTQCQLGKPGTYSLCELRGVGFKRCWCVLDAISRPNDPKCLKKAEFLGDVCEHTEQCIANLPLSSCIGNQCLCGENHVPSENNLSCLEKRNLDQTCTENKQCNHTQPASCQLVNPIDPRLGSICKCDAGYETIPRLGPDCYKMATVIGDSCEQVEQCRNLQGTNCQGTPRLCQCNSNTHVPNARNTRCLPRVDYGGACEETRQCRGSNKECFRNASMVTSRCLCRNNEYTLSNRTAGECVQIIKEVNGPCIEDVQCIAGLGELSSCDRNTCKCDLHAIFYNGRCRRVARLGEPCIEAEECYVGVNNATICSTVPPRRCQCHAEADPFEDKCYFKKKIGDSCTSERECTAHIQGAYCDVTSKTCTCRHGLVNDNDEICAAGENGLRAFGALTLIVGLLTFFI